MVSFEVRETVTETATKTLDLIKILIMYYEQASLIWGKKA